MELSDLRAFARIADLSSISATARTTGAPKSTISRSLTRLEAELGAILVDRSTRHLRLTDAGRLFRPYAQRILADVEEAATALDAFGAAPRGTLRISAPLAVSVSLIAPMLPAFLDAHPQVRVVLTVDNRRIDMPVEEADLVIRVGVLADSDLIARRLLTSESWTCASPAYLAAKGAPRHVAELNGHRLIGYSDQPAAWCFRSADGAVERFDVPPGDAISDSAALEPVLIGGAGIAACPTSWPRRPSREATSCASFRMLGETRWIFTPCILAIVASRRRSARSSTRSRSTWRPAWAFDLCEEGPLAPHPTPSFDPLTAVQTGGDRVLAARPCHSGGEIRDSCVAAGRRPTAAGCGRRPACRVR